MLTDQAPTTRPGRSASHARPVAELCRALVDAAGQVDDVPGSPVDVELLIVAAARSLAQDHPHGGRTAGQELVRDAQRDAEQTVARAQEWAMQLHRDAVAAMRDLLEVLARVRSTEHVLRAVVQRIDPHDQRDAATTSSPAHGSPLTRGIAR